MFWEGTDLAWTNPDCRERNRDLILLAKALPSLLEVFFNITFRQIHGTQPHRLVSFHALQRSLKGVIPNVN
jgi:hypothetical protein